MLLLIQIYVKDSVPNTVKTCVTSKVSDQFVHPPCIAGVFVYSSLDSLDAVDGTCDQRRLWSDYAEAQANLSLRWSHKSYCRFSRALAHLHISYLHIIGRTHHTQTGLHAHAQFVFKATDTTGVFPPFFTRGSSSEHKRQKDCLWKQRTHYRLENGSLGFIETLHKQ